MTARRDVGFALSTLLLGLVMYGLVTSEARGAPAPPFGLGTWAWPKATAISFIVLSAIQLIGAFRSARGDGDAMEESHSSRSASLELAGERQTHILRVIGVVLLMVLIYPTVWALGFFVGGSLALAATLGLMGLTRWGPLALTVVILQLFVWMLFEVALGIALPRPALF